MRPRILIFCGLVLAVCLWFLLRRAPEQQPKTEAPEAQAPLTNRPLASQPSPPPAKVAAAQNLTSGPPPAFAADAVRRGSTEGIKDMQQRALADWQRPIEFYGKVVDEDTNPVADASITFGWSESPTEEAARKAMTKSDGNGLFSLHGEHGPALDVWVGKEGYYVSHGGQWGFSYLNGFSSDPMNPVVFFLQKKGKGESLITTDYPGFAKIAQLHHDGTPVELDLFNGTQVPAGSGQLKLEFWRAITNQNANVFDWKCRLSVPGGGLVETPEEFAFQAPEGGYQSPVVIDMPATNENWQGEFRSKYYMQLPDGKYGRIDFYLLSFNGVFTVQSAINPTGSRNLEPPP
jgi:hypothetical protein